jgi:hypothetical protein
MYFSTLLSIIKCCIPISKFEKNPANHKQRTNSPFLNNIYFENNVIGFWQEKSNIWIKIRRIFGKDQVFGLNLIFGVDKEPNIRLFGNSVGPVVGRPLFSS